MSSAPKITHDYESWLRRQIPVIDADLETKHAQMKADGFTFFRATYYLWLARVAEQVPEVLRATTAPIVGDLHAENFGTWRDDSGDLRWGVNDLDELARGAWLLDPLRLAASAAMSPHLDLRTKDIADLVLEGYSTAVAGPSPRLSGARHLAALVPTFKDSDAFFKKLTAGAATADVDEAVRQAAAATVPGDWSPSWHVRQAGAGSLGHRRVVGVGRTAEGWAAREAKQLDPGTAAWARSYSDHLPIPAPDLYPAVVRTLDAPRASARVAGWQLRALAPDEVRIELSGLADADVTLVLKSMGAAMASVHGVDRQAFEAAQREARALDPDVFRGYVKTMKQTIEQDFENSR
ncbi:hypothetical protein Back2_19490 [Nocardioides baekrokdamisoli]|uniref:DUF2252 domain-containing protein n=1 Tax=Nocardioides baekrokdamisoli TaxID=1804624 RepID=A0A3G9IHI3_9ACTN|nr:DUF2252 family protein [Nocardioides baekrokdamisoli]BBH17662.1 hypothetical protein Back2_19490 [Nocardioides baekrokdamisoli]